METLKKIKALLLSYKKEIMWGLGALLIAFSFTIYRDYRNGNLPFIDNLLKASIATPAKRLGTDGVKPAEKVMPPIINNSYNVSASKDFFKGSDFVTLNLSEFELTKEYVKAGKEYKVYRQFGATDRYFTIATPLPKITKVIPKP